MDVGEGTEYSLTVKRLCYCPLQMTLEEVSILRWSHKTDKRWKPHRLSTREGKRETIKSLENYLMDRKIQA